MRGADEDDWPITRDVESTAGPYLSEEYLGNHPPKHQSRFICDFRHFEDGAGVSYKVLCENGHEEERKRGVTFGIVGAMSIRCQHGQIQQHHVGIESHRLPVSYHYYYDILLRCADACAYYTICQATEVSAR
jgi:hypothetical protein